MGDKFRLPAKHTTRMAANVCHFAVCSRFVRFIIIGVLQPRCAATSSAQPVLYKVGQQNLSSTCGAACSIRVSEFLVAWFVRAKLGRRLNNRKNEKAQRFLGRRAYSYCGHCPHPSNHLDGRIHQPSSWAQYSAVAIRSQLLSLTNGKIFSTCPSLRNRPNREAGFCG